MSVAMRITHIEDRNVEVFRIILKALKMKCNVKNGGVGLSVLVGYVEGKLNIDDSSLQDLYFKRVCQVALKRCVHLGFATYFNRKYLFNSLPSCIPPVSCYLHKQYPVGRPIKRQCCPVPTFRPPPCIPAPCICSLGLRCPCLKNQISQSTPVEPIQVYSDGPPLSTLVVPPFTLTPKSSRSSRIPVRKVSTRVLAISKQRLCQNTPRIPKLPLGSAINSELNVSQLSSNSNSTIRTLRDGKAHSKIPIKNRSKMCTMPNSYKSSVSSSIRTGSEKSSSVAWIFTARHKGSTKPSKIPIPVRYKLEALKKMTDEFMSPDSKILSQRLKEKKNSSSLINK